MPPRFLYRVYDDQSVSRFDEVDGFLAGNPNAAFNRNRYWAKFVVRRHMHWGNRRPTPFISVTASRAKALHYATQREKMGHRDVSIAKIDTAKLRASGVIFYHMASLVKKTGARIDPVAWNYSEYLCMWRIPPEAVVEVRKHEEVYYVL